MYPFYINSHQIQFFDRGGFAVRGNKKTTVNSVKGKRTVAGKKSVAKSKSATEPKSVVTLDRRTTGDRRNQPNAAVAERRPVERRAKVNRRRQIDPTTCERDYTIEEVEFMTAMDEYKRRNGRMFPTCSEVLEVIRSLGYEKRAKVDPVIASVEQTVETVTASVTLIQD